MSPREETLWKPPCVSDGIATQRVAFCPEHPILFDSLTSAEHLRYYAVLKGILPNQAENTVTRTLKAATLWNKRDQRVGSLSGTKRKKLMVAISVLCSPKVLVLNEISKGLRAAKRRSLWRTVRAAAREGGEIVFVSHDAEEVLDYSTVAGAVAAGQVDYFGTLRDPEHALRQAQDRSQSMEEEEPMLINRDSIVSLANRPGCDCPGTKLEVFIYSGQSVAPALESFRKDGCEVSELGPRSAQLIITGGEASQRFLDLERMV